MLPLIPQFHRDPLRDTAFLLSILLHATAVLILALWPHPLPPVPEILYPASVVLVFQPSPAVVAAAPQPHPSAPGDGRPQRIGAPGHGHPSKAAPSPPAQPSPEPSFDDVLRNAASAAGSPTGTGKNGRGGLGASGGWSIADVIRAQVERHWIFDVKTLGDLDDVIAIHVVIDPDGTVQSAAIIDTPKLRDDPNHHSLALSARNAVLTSSPLLLPPGIPVSALDLTLTFNPRWVRR